VDLLVGQNDSALVAILVAATGSIIATYTGEWIAASVCAAGALLGGSYWGIAAWRSRRSAR
jgi:hypothetical protein